MPNVVSIATEKGGRQYLADITAFSGIKKGDKLVINGDSCIEFAFILTEPKNIEKLPENVRTVIRVATEEDEKTNEKLSAKAKENKLKVQQKVDEYHLLMKLISVTESLDSKRLLVIYTANDRVDFRALVKDLAGIFHTRVEMRQIGEREATCMVGGCGPCGQELCCRRFLGDKSQVVIKMAKTQGLALNPSKINGVCGKLMCCLQYEYPQYKEIQDAMPKLGETVMTKDGVGTVVFQDLLNELVAVKIKKGDTEEVNKYKLSDFK